MGDGGGLEDFFLKHSILKEKEDDEYGPKARAANSDSEARCVTRPRGKVPLTPAIFARTSEAQR